MQEGETTEPVKSYFEMLVRNLCDRCARCNTDLEGKGGYVAQLSSLNLPDAPTDHIPSAMICVACAREAERWLAR